MTEATYKASETCITGVCPKYVSMGDMGNLLDQLAARDAAGKIALGNSNKFPVSNGQIPGNAPTVTAKIPGGNVTGRA